MKPGLEIGGLHVLRYTVPVHQTVPDLLPALPEFRRDQPVFATGFMVGLMEAPCMAAVYPYLEPGEVTVGTLINMSHAAPSPPGTALVAQARVIALDGRCVRFEVVVVDHTGEVAAAGEHVLRVIEIARFRDRLAAKRAQRRHRFQVRGDDQRLQRQHRTVTITAKVSGSRSHTTSDQHDRNLIRARQRHAGARTASGGPH